MSTSLTNAQTRFLRGQAHGLKAMLQMGAKGLTDAVVAEVDLALEHHELIKVKVAADDREARDAMIASLAERSGAVAGVQVEAPAFLIKNDLLACVRGACVPLRFPPSGSSQIVSYPFALR